MSVMAQTLLLAFKIALVWAGGFVLAVAVRAILPDKTGVNFFAGDGSVFVSYSRIGFWTCLLAAVTVTALVVIRAMLVDFGLRQMR
jgi:hypothetical protein